MDKIYIEEAAREYSKNVLGEYENDLYPNSDETLGEVSQTDFKAGVKWLQEKLEEIEITKNR